MRYLQERRGASGRPHPGTRAAMGAVLALAAANVTALANNDHGPAVVAHGPSRPVLRAPAGAPAPVADQAGDVPAPTASPPPPAPGDAVIAPPPEAFQGAPAPKAAPPPALRLTRFDNVIPSGGTWALVIGINDYPGADHDLRSAVSDAADVDLALARLGVPGDHRLVLRDGQADAATIETALDWLVAHAGAEATVVVFYAGHVRKLGPGTEALVGADGHLITDAALAQRLKGLKARRAWVAVAACYGGGFTEVLGPGRVLTGAAPADQLAYENSTFGRSYLVQYMVRKAFIEGRASATVQRAFAFAQEAIAREYPGRQPVQYESAAAALDLRPPAPPAPPPPAPPTTQPVGTIGTGPGGCPKVGLGVVSVHCAGR